MSVFCSGLIFFFNPRYDYGATFKRNLYFPVNSLEGSMSHMIIGHLGVFLLLLCMYIVGFIFLIFAEDQNITLEDFALFSPVS